MDYLKRPRAETWRSPDSGLRPLSLCGAVKVPALRLHDRGPCRSISPIKSFPVERLHPVNVVLDNFTGPDPGAQFLDQPWFLSPDAAAGAQRPLCFPA